MRAKTNQSKIQRVGAACSHWLRCVVRWAWMKSTGEDIFVMTYQRDSLERLNMLHCDFLEELVIDHPELKYQIQAHHMKRGNINT